MEIRTRDDVTQLRRGALELAVLVLLSGGERYGGEIVDALAARPGLAVSQGTLYPLLSRLRKAGTVETTWQESPVGPPRRYYRLSATGRAELRRQTEAWRLLSADMHALLKEVGS